MRIGLIPVLGLMYLLPFPWSHGIAAFIFALASATDWLDGFLARRLGQTSAFGAFLDPVADKLMVAVALIALVVVNPSPILAVLAAIIIGREITVSALREWMAELGQRRKVAVSMLGKVKTFSQMTAIVLLLYGQNIGTFQTRIVGLYLLALAAVLTLWSMLLYLKAAWSTFGFR